MGFLQTALQCQGIRVCDFGEICQLALAAKVVVGTVEK